MDHAAAAPLEVSTAPGDLELVQRFVNTLDIERGTDELGSPAALAGWLRSSGLLPAAGPAGPGSPPSPGSPGGATAAAADLRLALALREALRGVLASHVAAGNDAGGGGAARAAAGLRTAAAALPVRIEVSDDGQVAAAPAGSGVAAGLAGILLIASQAASTGTWPRLKVCSASDCQWAFYDRSPTRTGCWCSMRVCGSRAKARAYRRRATGRNGRS